MLKPLVDYGIALERENAWGHTAFTLSVVTGDISTVLRLPPVPARHGHCHRSKRRSTPLNTAQHRSTPLNTDQPHLSMTPVAVAIAYWQKLIRYNCFDHHYGYLHLHRE